MLPSYLASVKKIIPTDHEFVLRDGDFVVSKTDQLGKITYCNPVFIEFSGYSEAELLGKPHNILRHPDMPGSIFNLLWNTIRGGDEFFGYFKNLRKDGGFYWVFANVIPRYGAGASEISGFFSVRRKPDPDKLKVIEDLYREMLASELRARSHNAIAAGGEVLNQFVNATDRSYREFILSV